MTGTNPMFSGWNQPANFNFPTYEAWRDRNVAPAAAPASTSTGAAPVTYSPAYGGIPRLTSPGASQKTALTSNIEALPTLKSLAGDINAFNLAQTQKQYQANLPLWNAMSGQSSANIMAALKGQVPADVLNLMNQQAAERGIATGAPGGPNASAAYLRALGLTSLGQQQYGEGALTGAVARMPRAPLYDVTRGLITPQEQIAQQTLADYLAAAPDPASAAAANMQAAQSGLNRGYGATRSPVSGGGGGGGSPASPQTIPGQIAQKYSPYQTAPSTGSSGSGQGAGWGVAYGPDTNTTYAGEVPADAWEDYGPGEYMGNADWWPNYIDTGTGYGADPVTGIPYYLEEEGY